MKKKLIIGSLIIVCILIVLAATPFARARLYNGDRITGAFELTVNGKEYSLKDTFVEYENHGKESLTYDGMVFSIKGGEYGAYSIGGTIETGKLFELTGDEFFKTLPEDIELAYCYHNSNWWNITALHLKANWYQENSEWKLKMEAEYTESTEKGGYQTDTVEKVINQKELTENEAITLDFGL